MDLFKIAVDMHGNTLTLQDVATGYFNSTGIGMDAAKQEASAFLQALSATAAGSIDYVHDYEVFVEENWGDGQVPEAIQSHLGDTPLSAREQYLLDLYKTMRSDYLMATGAGGETGEFLEVLKKGVRRHAHDRGRLVDESGDALYYLTVILRRHGIRLREVMRFNKAKLIERGGPRTPGYRFPEVADAG